MADRKFESRSEPVGPRGVGAKPAAAQPRRSGVRIAAVTAAVLAAEAGVLWGAFSAMGPRRSEAAAPPPPLIEAEEQFVEICVFDDRVTNDASGATYQYKADIHLKVRARHAAAVEEGIKRAFNEIREEMSGIFRTAEPEHFLEPLHETLRRRIETALRERFDGAASEASPTIERVLLVIGSGIRISR